MNSSSGKGRLKVRFWGVRGSVPTPLRTHLQTGGNTACVEIQYDEEPVVVIDSGTGIRSFGQYLQAQQSTAFEATLLLSHFHWDHIQGFPFFGPLYSKESELRIVSGRPADELRANLEQQMREPFFPMVFRNIPARYSCAQIPGEGFQVGSLSVSPITMNHPGLATGFRIDSPAGTVAYVSDHEHGHLDIDRQIERKAAAADVMIYDAHFTPEEYPSFVGWGHSTWLEGARLAERAGVKKLVLFHHNPNRTDEQMRIVVERTREVFANSEAATEENGPFIVAHRL